MNYHHYYVCRNLLNLILLVSCFSRHSILAHSRSFSLPPLRHLSASMPKTYAVDLCVCVCDS